MLTPTTEQELAEAVAAANGPLRILGGGTRTIGHAEAGEVLSVAGLSGISLYDPGALTLVAGAGTPLNEIEETLASEGQMLPFEPPKLNAVLGREGVSTIGGVVATNASGPRRIQAGACRDSLIGVRFVDGRGDIIKNGGRVMKNVTGYDLVKLMAGSHGTLGVLTEVSFKVLPASASRAVVALDSPNVAAAIKAMCRALGSPFEVNGAAHGPIGLNSPPKTLIRVEGMEASVTYRAEHLKSLLAAFGDVQVISDPGEASAQWAAVRDVSAFAEFPGDLWRISVKPTDGDAVAKQLPEAALMFDWGGGLVWAGVPRGTDVRSLIRGIPGHATLVRASDETKERLGVFPPEPAPLAFVSSRLRAEFDPRAILNPSMMG